MFFGDTQKNGTGEGVPKWKEIHAIRVSSCHDGETKTSPVESATPSNFSYYFILHGSYSRRFRKFSCVRLSPKKISKAVFEHKKLRCYGQKKKERRWSEESKSKEEEGKDWKGGKGKMEDIRAMHAQIFFCEERKINTVFFACFSGHSKNWSAKDAPKWQIERMYVHL